MAYHVQVAGCARSGTTLMGNLLRCFDGIEFADHEAEIIVGRFVRRFGYPRDPGNVFGGKRASSLNWYRKAGLDPSIKILWMVRDGRDVVLSEHRGRQNYVAPDRWITMNAEAIDFQRQHPDQVFFIRFEDLVLDYDQTMRSVAGHVGLDLRRTWAEVWPEIEPEGRFSREMRGIRPLDPTVVGKWKARAEEVRRAVGKSREGFSAMLVRLGYEQDESWETQVWGTESS